MPPIRQTPACTFKAISPIHNLPRPAMKTIVVLLTPMLPLGGVFAQTVERHTLSGYLRDTSSGETLTGATVYIKEAKTGVAANNYGFYSISLPVGSYTVTYSYVGFATRTRTVDLSQNRTINMELPQLSVQTTEVVISGERAEREENVKSVQMSVQKLDIKTIKALPPLLGEVDIVRAVQLLPGVTTVGEGATGFNVRGGSVDHNLVLLDEAPVYNSSHLFGLFSVFNPDAVRDVKLYKGGIPAAYGGRLASLLDVRMKEGNNKRFEGNGGIGTIMSRFSFEGPIKKDKASFIIAGRRSYIDVLAKPFLSSAQKGSKFYFYDFSGKVNWKIDDKNTVYASGYLGRDVFGFGDAFFFNWGNATATTRWNHVFNQKLFANATLLYSDYNYELGSNQGVQGFSWKSKIKTVQGRYDLTHYIAPELTLSYGVSSILYTFVPGEAGGTGTSIFNELKLPNQRAFEHAAYAQAEHRVLPRLTLQYGLRISAMDYRGNGDTAYSYTAGAEGQRATVASTDLSGLGNYKTFKFYPNLEPRLAINYTLDEKSSIKASYMRTAQYIHLISNTTAASPLDVWTPSTQNIKPQLQDQVALGYFRNFGPESDWETSAEVFYKDLQNQIDYVDGAQLLLNRRLEGELLRGKGRAYGLELYIKRNTGRLTGFASFTLSKTERQVNGINFNNWYVSKFDRPVSFTITGSYELRPRLSISALFTYISGTPATFPVGKAEVGGISYPLVDGRNQTRISPYHRMDLSVIYKRPRRKRFNSEWVFAVYNVYSRRNAFSIYARQGGGFNGSFSEKAVTEMRRISVFGSFIPSITYNFSF